ncbi:hypothetical protein IAU59_004875 [Kwoniella sp. CBS 9459]
MDSPLLPQLDRHPDMSLLDDPSMLDDMTLDSEPNATAHEHEHECHVDRGGGASHLFTREHDRIGGSVSGSGGTAPFRPGGGGGGGIFGSAASGGVGGSGRRAVTVVDHQLDDEDDDTPVKDRYGPSAGEAKVKAKPRFSLFAPPQPPLPEGEGEGFHYDDDDEDDAARYSGEDEDQTVHGRALNGSGDPGRQQSESSRAKGEGGGTIAGREARETKLRESLYELRRMNEVFDGFLGALEGVRGHNERLAQRVHQTSELLDEYTAIMGQTEFTQRLLLNPKWTGSADDAEAIAAEEQARYLAQQAAEEEARRQVEAARLAEEEKERRAALTKERSERGPSARGGAGGLTGRGRPRGGATSGARAGAGVRGASTAATAGRTRVGTGIPRSSTLPRPTSTSNLRRGATASTTASTSTASGSGSNRTSGTSSGLGGQYSHVKSSGYGPR